MMTTDAPSSPEAEADITAGMPPWARLVSGACLKMQALPAALSDHAAGDAGTGSADRLGQVVILAFMDQDR